MGHGNGIIAQWLAEYRDWESGSSTITFISKIPGAKTTEDFHPKLIPTQNSGFYYLG